MKNVEIIINSKKIVCGLFGVIASMVMMAFFHGDNVLGGDNIGATWTAIIVVLTGAAVILAIPHYNFRKINFGSLMLVACIIIYTLFCMFHNYNSQYNGVLLLAQWLSFSFLPNDMKKLSFIIFRRIFVVICAVGIICFLSYMMNIPISYSEVPYYFNSDTLSYVDYGVSFLFKGDGMVRLCGLCNEPGYLGTFCALLLCVDGMNLKRKANWILLMAGIMTFSVAFLIILAIYLLVRAIVTIIKSHDIRKKVLYSLGVVVAFILYFAVLPNVKTGDLAVDTTLQRLTITEDGLVGDNRNTEKFDAEFSEVMEEAPLFGKGKGYMGEMELGNNSTYKTMVAEFGIMGCLLIWGTLLAGALYGNRKNKDVVLFILVFFASIYQRPGIMTIPYLLVLMGGIEYIKSYASVNKIKRLESKNDSE